MKRLLPIILAFALAAPDARALISRDPNFTLLWNGFNSVFVRDSFVVAAGNDGLMVLRYDSATSLYGPVTTRFLDSRPARLKVTADVMSVQTDAQTLYFYDLSRLPELAQLGYADLGGTPITDFDLHGQSLFVCRGFKGLWRYQLTNYSSPQFIDSSMLGIHYVQVQSNDSELLALDDYNGILRYRLDTVGFGTFIDYLYIPFRVSSFLAFDSTIALSTDTDAVMLARFGAAGPTIFDTIGLFSVPQRMYAIDTMLVVTNDDMNLVEVVSLRSFTVFHSYLLDAPALNKQAAVFERYGENFIMFAGASGGLLTYSLDELWFNPAPRQGLGRPGNITGLAMIDNRLYTAGVANPLDAYSLALDGNPTFDTTYLQGLNQVSAMTNNGDTLFVQYTQMKRVFILEMRPESLAFGGAILNDADPVVQLLFNPHYIDTLRSFFVAQETKVRLYTISDPDADSNPGLILPAGSVSVLGRIRRIAVLDSVLCIASNKGLWLYRIYNDFTTDYRTHIDLTAEANHLLPYQGKLLVFDANDMVVFDITDPALPVVDTTIAMPFGVYGATFAEDRLYTVGPYGIMVFDATGPLPSLLDYGGRSGSLIAAENGIVAVSDGSAIHIFDLRTFRTDFVNNDNAGPESFSLEQNYPNPFNPSTTIAYYLPYPSRVDLIVYNILGQEVITLVDEVRPAGIHTVEWDGSTSAGSPASTGVYFYRLTAGERTETRKMILLK
ncbi:MAG: T9SS type A sorting domain-containing protein [Candidatus Zixiibacteriota bacterium]